MQLTTRLKSSIYSYEINNTIITHRHLIYIDLHFHLKIPHQVLLDNPSTQWAHYVQCTTLILHWYIEDQISTKFHVTFTYFFDVISLMRKSTSFPRTFVPVILLLQKSTLFPRTFFDVILMVGKSTLFSHSFFDVISMIEKSMFYARTFIGLILLAKKSTLFPRTFFDIILIDKKSALFPRTFFDKVSQVKISTLFLPWRESSSCSLFHWILIESCNLYHWKKHLAS